MSLLLLLAWSSRATAGILKLDLDDVIHPITAEYVVQGIAQAEAEQSAAVILRLSTPGGLDPSMRQIIEKILSSKVPVIVFVGPSGVRAASAGFFILLAADLAVMAPGTNTGAAHPVSIGGGKPDEVMAKKIENDAAAYLRSFTAKRGRNAAVAEKGVTESKSFTETEALKEGLIDGVAKDVDAIVEQFDGKTIQRFDGSSIALKLKGESVRVFRDVAAAARAGEGAQSQYCFDSRAGRFDGFVYRVHSAWLDAARSRRRSLPFPGHGGIEHSSGECSGSRFHHRRSWFSLFWRRKSPVTACLPLSELRRWYLDR